MPIVSPKRSVLYFSDESSLIGEDYMAVAGLAVPDAIAERMRADLAQIKAANGNPREVKWSDTKERRDSPERAFADYFEKAVKEKQIHFHIRFAPFGEYDHKLSGPMRRADTTSKMHFQLLLHRAVRFYGPHYKLRLHPDDGHCTAGLLKQVDNLHWHANSHYGTPMDCIEHVECLRSEDELLLQLLDIPLGAMTALRNRRNLAAPKASLAAYVGAKWPNLDLAKSTGPRVMDFSVWNVTPKARKGSPWSYQPG